MKEFNLEDQINNLKEFCEWYLNEKYPDKKGGKNEK